MPVISIRVSDEWLAAVDAECERRIWKRNAAVVNLVWIALADKEKRDGNQAGSDTRSQTCPSCGSVGGVHARGCKG